MVFLFIVSRITIASNTGITQTTNGGHANMEMRLLQYSNLGGRSLIDSNFNKFTKRFTNNNQDINECIESPCNNSGTCQNTFGSFKCQCSFGWSGPTCSVDIDECLEYVCLNAQSCINNYGSYRCQGCADGYGGETCTDIDECHHSDICLNGGTCLNTFGSYYCVCPKGFTGGKCQITIPECAACNLCGVTADCVNADDGKTKTNCDCNQRVIGELSQDDITECLSLPCLHNGTCYNLNGSYSCICHEEWTGYNCQSDLNECTVLLPCSNDGNCTNYDGGYKCDCTSGWSGINCSDDFDECNDFSVCVNGICSNFDGGYNCTCLSGWEGQSCTLDADECFSSPCHNNGSCENTPGSYDCKCTNYWTGAKCDKYINEFDNFPCHNNATCINTVSGFICECSEGFTGLRCEQDIVACNSTSCVNKGTCKEGTICVQCLCPSGWTGDHCEIDIDECQTRECSGDFKCANTTGSYYCLPASMISTSSDFTSNKMTTIAQISDKTYDTLVVDGNITATTTQTIPDSKHMQTTSLLMLASDKEVHTSSTQRVSLSTLTVPLNSYPDKVYSKTAQVNSTLTITWSTVLSQETTNVNNVAHDHEVYSIQFEVEVKINELANISDAVKVILEQTICKNVIDVSVNATFGQRRNFIQVQATCNGTKLSNTSISAAFQMMPREKLQSLFPVKILFHKEREKSWLQSDWKIVVYVGVCLILTVAIIAGCAIYRYCRCKRAKKTQLYDAKDTLELFDN